MKRAYKKGRKIKFNNNVFQIIIRDDYKYGFLKIVDDDKYEYPSAYEFLHLSSVLNKNNRIKF